MAYSATDHADHDHHGPAKGFIRRWVLTTNHKDIGTMYLVFAGIMFFIGGAMAMVIRAELFKPGMQFVDPAHQRQIGRARGQRLRRRQPCLVHQDTNGPPALVQPGARIFHQARQDARCQQP